ncbi:MAG: citrate/2-methylcitrate synthase [Clostridiales bacterium]|nr:citrate/2-methylcitrate synthase [Clostridiales bacterium]
MSHAFHQADELKKLADICYATPKFTEETYKKNQVKRGLRDENGAGVITGLTDISDVIAKKMIDGVLTPCDGELYYRGIDVRNMIDNYDEDAHCGFEEATYLLFFNKLPNKDELDAFKKLLASYRKLPRNFVRDVIMKAPNKDIMNSIARCILMLYSYDKNALDNSIENVLKQCLTLTAIMPMLAVYAYNAHSHYNENNSFYIHRPKPEYSTAENVLHMLREDSKFTSLEAKVLDIAFILHAEHGGGNNSTFTTHVVTSAGTDTYSTITAALCSLKGPKHGGANIKVMEMFADLKKHVKDWTDRDAVKDYLSKLLEGKAYDGAGLIYGMGHAVYSISDPRAQVFKGYVSQLAAEKGREKEMALYKLVEEVAQELISAKRKVNKGVAANVDFYSGFVYNMLGLPVELFTPMFAVSRIAGWSAHRMEELLNNGKIIRPAYVSTNGRNPYIKMEDRK